MKWVLILIISVICKASFCQDTLSIYFEFGKSKLPEDQLVKLNQLASNFDLSELDSVHYIGLADSVGKISSNLKLSLKRAKHVENYCSAFIDESVSSKIFAQGEALNPKQELNRRVDVILFFPKPTQDEIEVVDTDKGCYRVDYLSISQCHIRTITKRGKEYVLIENDWIRDIDRYKKLYYGSTNDKGEFVPKKVSWKSKKTGSLWWKKKRKLATIPKKDFDNYLLFWIDPEPCEPNCHEDFNQMAEIVNVDTCRIQDIPVNHYLQYRYPLLNRKEIKARVPNYYIDSLATYYTHNPNWEVIDWKSNRIGKNRRHYSFTKLPVINHQIKNPAFIQIETIYRDQLCHSNPSSCPKNEGGLDEPFELKCLTINPPFKLIRIEIGGHYQGNELVGYGAIGTGVSSLRIDSELFGGIHTKGTFYGSLRLRYNFFSFWLEELNPKTSWRNKGSKLNWWQGRFYLGTECKTSMGKSTYEYLEQNVHLGISFVDDDLRFPMRIFIQSGFGLNFYALGPVKVYPIIQIGYHASFFRSKR